jgi:ADP-ribose pyrophosphatase YjhB (NUDIX family)
VKRTPKTLLLELPTADEIDQLATTTPHLEVRRFEYDMGNCRPDLNYAPCKGEMVLVIVGEDGVALVRPRGSDEWRLPSGKVRTHETAIQAAKRVAKEECGLALRSLELAGIYEVVWHYSDISVKRLHLIYAAVTDDRECHPEGDKSLCDAMFFTKVPDHVLGNDLMRNALDDCSEK